MFRLRAIVQSIIKASCMLDVHASGKQFSIRIPFILSIYLSSSIHKIKRLQNADYLFKFL